MRSTLHLDSTHTRAARNARRIQPGWTPLIRAVHARWGEYAREFSALRERDVTEKAVHDYRVASQRLVAALRVCAHAAPDSAAAKLRRRIRRRVKRFRRLRDVQVMAQRLAPAADTPAIARLERRLSREADSLRRRLCRNLPAEAPRSELAALHAVLADMGTIARGVVRKRVYVLLQQRLAVEQRRVRRCAAGLSSEDGASLHRLRIAIKRARYLLELVAAVRAAPRAGAAAKTARQWQDVLGLVQDLRVLEDELAAYRPKDPLDAAALDRFRTRIAAEREDAMRAFFRQRDALEAFVGQIRLPAPKVREPRPELRSTA